MNLGEGLLDDGRLELRVPEVAAVPYECERAVAVLLVELDRAGRADVFRDRGLRLLARARVLHALGNADEDPVGIGRLDPAQRVDLDVENAVDLQMAASRLEIDAEIDGGDDRLVHRRTDEGDDLEE